MEKIEMNKEKIEEIKRLKEEKNVEDKIYKEICSVVKR